MAAAPPANLNSDQVIDMAISSETGVVNFPLLQFLLHGFVRRLDYSEARMQHFAEVNEKMRSALEGLGAKLPKDLLLPEEKFKDDSKEKDTKGGKGAKGKKDSKKGAKAEVPEDLERSALKPSVQKATSLSMFSGLAGQPSVKDDKIYTEVVEIKNELQKFKDIVDGTAGVLQTHQEVMKESSNVLELFTMLNIVKRVEALEESIGTLARAEEKGGGKKAWSIPDGSTYTERDQSTQMGVDAEAFTDGEGGGSIISPEGSDAFLKQHLDISQMSPGECLGYLGEQIRLLKEHFSNEKKGNEDKYNQCINQLNSLDITYGNQICSVLTQISDLTKYVELLEEQLKHKADAAPKKGAEDVNISDLFHRVVQVEDDVEDICETLRNWAREQEDKGETLKTVLDDIDRLKNCKVDRDDMEMALADKADLCIMSKKVSYDAFDKTCDDLSKGMEEALQKLQEQEDMWQQALNDIQSGLGTKLEKQDVLPLKEFINSKLAALHQKVKSLSKFQKDREAAGSKAVLLRNINCISCDTEVVMKKKLDVTNHVPPPVSLPPIKSMAPYLAYELDSLRRQQKILPNVKNLNHFENAVNQGANIKDAKDHFCNRYCGGSHTTTTPQQRVARLGHFLDQWGPDPGGPLAKNLKGTDGQIYIGEGSEEAPTKEANARQTVYVQGDIIADRKEPPKVPKENKEEVEKKAAVPEK